MAYTRHFQPCPRAPRLALRGEASAAVLLENGRQFTVRLHQLSITGGLLEISAYVDERSRISIAFPLGSSNVHASAELMFPMRGGMGYMQPFRFTRFGAGVRQTLDVEISAILKQRAAISRPGQILGLRAPRFSLDQL